jgi:hypothetical protein
MARPSKLTPELQQKIITRLVAGSTITATCDSIGITDATFRNWINRGKAEAARRDNPRVKEGTKQWADEDPFFVFFMEATRAMADGLVHATARFREGMNPSQSETITTETVIETKTRTIKKPDGTIEQVPYEATKTITRRTVSHIPGDWRAAMEYLARRDPDNWARSAPQKHEVTGKDGGAIIIQSGQNMDDL